MLSVLVVVVLVEVSAALNCYSATSPLAPENVNKVLPDVRLYRRAQCMTETATAPKDDETGAARKMGYKLIAQDRDDGCCL